MSGKLECVVIGADVAGLTAALAIGEHVARLVGSWGQALERRGDYFLDASR